MSRSSGRPTSQTSDFWMPGAGFPSEIPCVINKLLGVFLGLPMTMPLQVKPTAKAIQAQPCPDLSMQNRSSSWASTYTEVPLIVLLSMTCFWCPGWDDQMSPCEEELFAHPWATLWKPVLQEPRRERDIRLEGLPGSSWIACEARSSKKIPLIMQWLTQRLRSSTTAQVMPNTCGQPSLSGVLCSGSSHGPQGQEAQVANLLGQEQKWQQVAKVKLVGLKWRNLLSSSSIRIEEIH